jgi:hypothetical protein
MKDIPPEKLEVNIGIVKIHLILVRGGAIVMGIGTQHGQVLVIINQ